MSKEKPSILEALQAATVEDIQAIDARLAEIEVDVGKAEALVQPVA